MINENNLKIKVSAKEQSLTQNGNSTFDQHKFISDIYECEKKRYIIEERIKDIDTAIKKYSYVPKFKDTFFQNEYKKNKKVYKSSKSPDSAWGIGELWSVFLGIGFFGAIVYDIHCIFSHTKHLFFDGIKGGFIFFIACIIIGLILSPIISKIDETKYKKKLHTWTDDERLKEKEIENFNENLIKDIEKKYFQYVDKLKKDNELPLQNLRTEKETAEKILKHINSTLEELYNLRLNGVLCLHPNYQGLVPISILYGYFDTGRCTQLQGHEGAYNLYEDEKMKGMIINKLDIVSRQLGQLQNAMVYVGQAIEECNNRLSDLESTSNRMIQSVNNMNNNVTSQLNGVSSQMAAIEENTANSAYYAEIGARMTTFNTVYNLLND